MATSAWPRSSWATRLFRVGDKVMQTRNNYDKDVFNGDIGFIDSINDDDNSLEVVIDGSYIVYDYSEMDDLMHAYCISTHRSQGSEYPAVVMPILTQHYLMLQRNLIYTAITRAKAARHPRRHAPGAAHRRQQQQSRRATQRLAAAAARLTRVQSIDVGATYQVARPNHLIEINGRLNKSPPFVLRASNPSARRLRQRAKEGELNLASTEYIPCDVHSSTQGILRGRHSRAFVYI